MILHQNRSGSECNLSTTLALDQPSPKHPSLLWHPSLFVATKDASNKNYFSADGLKRAFIVGHKTKKTRDWVKFFISFFCTHILRRPSKIILVGKTKETVIEEIKIISKYFESSIQFINHSNTKQSATDKRKQTTAWLD